MHATFATIKKLYIVALLSPVRVWLASLAGPHPHLWCPACTPFAVVQVEHQRRLRQLAEDEAKLTAEQLQLQAERQAVAAAATRQAMQEQAQEQTGR